MTTDESSYRRACDRLLRTCIEAGRVPEAIEAARLGAGTEAIDHLVRSCIERNSLGWALEAASAGASVEQVGALVQACIERQWVAGAIRAAGLKGGLLAPDEIDRLCESLARG